MTTTTTTIIQSLKQLAKDDDLTARTIEVLLDTVRSYRQHTAQVKSVADNITRDMARVTDYMNKGIGMGTSPIANSAQELAHYIDYRQQAADTIVRLCYALHVDAGDLFQEITADDQS